MVNIQLQENHILGDGGQGKTACVLLLRRQGESPVKNHRREGKEREGKRDKQDAKKERGKGKKRCARTSAGLQETVWVPKKEPLPGGEGVEPPHALPTRAPSHTGMQMLLELCWWSGSGVRRGARTVRESRQQVLRRTYATENKRSSPPHTHKERDYYTAMHTWYGQIPTL